MAATRESKADLKARAAQVATRLIAAYPDAGCRLNFTSPFELLVATILAAQCTDDMVNRVTPSLFKRAAAPEKLARMRPPTIEKLVKSTGFFRNKARSLRNMSARLLDAYGGEVPREMDDLVTLPGVARKTANVVRAAAFGLPAVITDTHVIRLSQRMRLTKNQQPEKIERDLMALLPQGTWSAFSHAMLFHGRAVCEARKPACDRCVVADRCPSAYQFPHLAEQRSPLVEPAEDQP